jgi:hypothetical protein
VISCVSIYMTYGQGSDTLVASSTLPNIFSISAGIQHGFIFAHSPAVENTKGARPTGIELEFGWQRNDEATWNLCNCFPRKGVLLAYYDYDTEILGKSITAAYFLEPNYRLGKRTFFSLKGAAGLSYLTNPFDSVKNFSNQSYSTSVSGYLLVGIGLWHRFSDQWSLNTTVNYQHISNGGISQPNKGINWPTVGMSLRYQKSTGAYYTGVRTKEKFWKHKPLQYDISLFGMFKKGTDRNGNRKRLPLVGLNVQGGKQVGRISILTLGAEISHDKSLQTQLKRDTIDASAVRAGVALGHQFILGKFRFSQQLGVYVFDQTPYYDRIYHRWGLHYMVNQRWGVGFNLRAHRHVADFIDLRISYSFR